MSKFRLTSRGHSHPAISFGRTAYVGRCGSKMLDAIEHGPFLSREEKLLRLHINGTGDGFLFTGYDELEELVDNLTPTEIANSESLAFLKDCLLAIRESYGSAGFTSDEEGIEIGDVVFVK